MQARRIFHVISRLPPVLIQTFVAKCSVYQRPIVEWIPRRIQRWNTQKTDAVFQDLIQISSYSMFARSQRPAQRNRPFFAILFWRDQARYGRGAGWASGARLPHGFSNRPSCLSPIAVSRPGITFRFL